MLSNPKHGWCDFQIGDFKGSPSYLTMVPDETLQAFIDYHKTGTGIAWYDEEGNEFTLVINPYALYIIEEKEKPVLHDFSDLKIKELEEELIKDIESNLDEWVSNFTLSDEQEEFNENKKKLCEKLEELKQVIRYRR